MPPSNKPTRGQVRPLAPPQQASGRTRPGSLTPVTSRCTRYVALHPNRRGVLPTDRVHRLPQQAQLRGASPDTHQPAPPRTQPRSLETLTSAPNNRRCTRYVAKHPLRRDTPVTSRCTRYVALHPIRRGVMPTDRVHRLPQQAQPRAISPHKPQPATSDAATHPRNARPGST